MGLFGGMGRSAPLSFMDAEIDPYATSKGPPGFSGPTQSTRRRGLFGRIGSAITPDRMMIAGQMLRDIGTGENNLPDLIAAQREQPFRDMQMQAAKQELGQSMSQQQALQAALAQITDPAERSLAAANPAAYVQAQMAARAPLTAAQNADFKNGVLSRQQQESQFERSDATDRRGQDISAMNSMRSAGGGMPSLTEARQWTNSYNDDTQSVLNTLGNLRAAIPYAQQVIQARGAPVGNARMNDVALLRAAARAQTGPGVLTESEVFGTLSPGLQQDLMRGRAYADISQTTLRPQDRLALAQYVQQGAHNASSDLWRRYSDAENVLGARGVEPSQVGISAPEYIHPDDESSFSSQPSSAYNVGRAYIAPSGRSYVYEGPGRFRYTGRQQYRQDWAMGRNSQQQQGGQNSGGQRRTAAQMSDAELEAIANGR